MSLVFFALRALPGDPCLAMLGDQATPEALQNCQHQLGLDRALLVQYSDYLWQSVHFEFGHSFRHHYPVASYILRTVPYTCLLILASMLIALAIGLPSGILSALYRRNPLLAYGARLTALLGLSMPIVWFGVLLLLAFSLYWDLFPLLGGGDLTTVLDMLGSGDLFTTPTDFLAAVMNVLHHLALPAFALGLTLAATVSRVARSAMLEVMSQDYMRPTRARRRAEHLVVSKRALRSMMLPLCTIVGVFMAVAMLGTVLTETVFVRPGVGKMLVDAMAAHDYPLAQGAITVFAMTLILANLFVDILHVVFEPRRRAGATVLTEKPAAPLATESLRQD
jgi:ABC-type dipeptide/oligopeptide/nickel transport system permease component